MANWSLHNGLKTVTTLMWGLLTTQLRYRWEIAPLTDFFLVYNRGNSFRNALESTADEIELNDLLSDSFNEPVIDTFVAKLRYRFGN